MKIRITGTSEQVQAMIGLIKDTRVDIQYISNEYKQNRKCKTSKYVAVYLDIKDFEE